MQEMTADICNDTKYVVTPKATIFNGTNVYGQTGTASAAANADTGNALSRPNHPNDPNYVPQTTLTDTRQTYLDGALTTKTYTVRKLADGNCWMTDNLALNWNSSRTFTSGDTNLNSVASKTVDVNTQSLDGTVTDAEKNAWAGAGTDAWLSRSSNGAVDSESRPYGTYYNWYTATMGSVLSTDSTPATAPDDICPKNWQLPRYEGSGSWLYLFREAYHFIESGKGNIYGTTGLSTILNEFPLDMVYAGNIYFGDGTRYDNETGGVNWSQYALPDNQASAVNFSDVYVGPNHGNQRRYGFSVRCVAKAS